MNKPLSYILVSGLSFAVGATLGYFGFKKYTEEKLQKMAEDAVNRELEAIQARETKEEPKPEPPSKEKCIIPEEEIPQQKYTPYEELCIKAALIEGSTNPFCEKEVDPAELEHPTEDDPDDIDDSHDENGEYIYDESDEAQLAMEQYADIPATVIPYEEFITLPPYFENVTYLYFEGDDTLVEEENDQLVEQVDILVGDALTRFGEGSPSEEAVYVMNGKCGLAIEIIRVHDRYERWVQT